MDSDNGKFARKEKDLAEIWWNEWVPIPETVCPFYIYPLTVIFTTIIAGLSP